MSGSDRPPLQARITGYAIAVIVVSGAARFAWELLQPLLPVLLVLLVLSGIYWLILSRSR